jgi:hypothetical protein
METTDIGFAAYIHALGKDIMVRKVTPATCVFEYEDCPDTRYWQSGKAQVNGLAFLNSYKTLLRRVKDALRLR